CLQGYDTPYSF
nr:immunoglobulin light chain junction region [Macaca mulatta]MOV80563.1 immunoglobulin light chain junction region [Macaca mulatta]